MLKISIIVNLLLPSASRQSARYISSVIWQFLTDLDCTDLLATNARQNERSNSRKINNLENKSNKNIKWRQIFPNVHLKEFRRATLQNFVKFTGKHLFRSSTLLKQHIAGVSQQIIRNLSEQLFYSTPWQRLLLVIILC